MPTNPFVTSTAVRVRNLFFGRQNEIQQLFTAISPANPQHCVIIGLPKSGKSSLLMSLTNPDLQQQYLSDPSKFLFVPVDCAVTNLDAPGDLYVRLVERVAQVSNQTIGGGNLLDAEAFLNAINDLRGGRRMILLLDEFDKLLASDGCSDEVLSRISSFVGPDVVMVATASDSIERICRRLKKIESQIWNLFSVTIYPSLLSQEQARQAIKQPILDSGITLDDSLVDMVIDMVGPHPFFLQVGGKELFDLLASNTIADSAAQQRLRENITNICRSYFNGFWRVLSVEDQAVLSAIIVGAGLPPKALAVAQRLRNWNLLVLSGEDFVPFSKLFGDYAKAMLVGEEPQKAILHEQPRCTLSLVCDSYAKNMAVRLQGAVSFVSECDELLDRNLRAFSIRGREDARSESWSELVKITGRELYQELFDQHLEAARAYQSARSTVGDARLKLRFIGPRDFIGLPFELLHDTNGRALALDHPISRMISGQICAQQPIDEGFLSRPTENGTPARSALLLSANVSGELAFKGHSIALAPIPDADIETLKIKALLENHAWKVTLLSGAELTLERATAELNACKYDLVHFSGHGFYAPLDADRSGLAFYNADGDILLLEALRIRQLLKEARTRFIFLSCCDSAASGELFQLRDNDYLGVLDAIVSAGVPAALGYRWPVSSAGALLLAQTFYDKLHQNESLEAALLLARQEVRAQLDDQTWLSPILVVQD